jgi:ABC-type glutathione transport system ATPase component
MPEAAHLLEASDLRVTFQDRGQEIRALRGVSFSLDRGVALGVVGRSGCGKSTLARAILRLQRLEGGVVEFDGMALHQLGERAMRRLRRRMQMIFQDPGGSLNEHMRVGSIIAEPLQVHHLARGRRLRERVAELLERVGLEEKDATRRPHEFSGGQKQRIAIARAIATEPDLLVCDEPTSALDVRVQARILELLTDLRQDLGLTILFISHDLAVVNQFCDEVIVMDQGCIVEQGLVAQIIHEPTSNAARSLLAARYTST